MVSRHSGLIEWKRVMIPLFRGRYKEILVQQDPYFLQVSRYIHRNPVDEALVENCVQDPWSSYRFL